VLTLFEKAKIDHIAVEKKNNERASERERKQEGTGFSLVDEMWNAEMIVGEGRDQTTHKIINTLISSRTKKQKYLLQDECIQ
jgi:hypothetical protein